MTRSAPKLGIMIMLALAWPLTVRAETTHTEELDVPTSSAAKMAVNDKDNNKTGMVSVVASNLPLSRVIGQVGEQSKVPVIMKGSAANTKVTIIAPRAKPVNTILQQIVADAPDLVLKETTLQSDDQGTTGYEIWLEDEYNEAAAVVEVYQLMEISARNMERLISAILGSEIIVVESDDRLNKVIVRAVPEKHAEVRKLISELDQNLTMQIFTLEHREAHDMMLTLSKFFSIPPDQITIDRESGQVAVKGTSETLTRIGQLIEAFDVPPPRNGDARTTVP